MFGAVAGDILGSPYINQKFDFEKENVNFHPISNDSKYTEISVMTLAVAEALMHSMNVPGEECAEMTEWKFRSNLIYWMRNFGRRFARKVRYGKKFCAWIHVRKPVAYNSLSNGSVLRISPIAWVFDNLEDVERFAEIAARVTNTNDDVINFARVMAGTVFLARIKKTKDEIKNYFHEKTGLKLSKTLEEIRPDFNFLTTCPESMLAAITTFLENETFDDVMKSSISLGGETTATASMAGAISEAFSGIKVLTEAETFERLPRRLQFTVEKWEQWKF